MTGNVSNKILEKDSSSSLFLRFQRAASMKMPCEFNLKAVLIYEMKICLKFKFKIYINYMNMLQYI